MNRLARQTLLSSHSRRYFSALVPHVEKETANVPANYTPPPPQPAKVVESPKPPTKLQTEINLMRSRIVWFCVGGFSVGLFGYWRLGEEVHQANTDLKTRLAAAHSDVQLLQSHIKEVENRLSKLEHHSTYNPPSNVV